MNLLKFKPSWQMLTNNLPVIVTDIVELKKYQDGKKTEETSGYRVEVVATGVSYEKFNVVVNEKPLIKAEHFGTVAVSFTNFDAKFYKNPQSGSIDVSCKAESCVISK